MSEIKDLKFTPEGLRAAREAAGLSMAKAGERVGVTYSHIWQIERGKKQPSPDVLVRLCTLYGIKDVKALAA